LPRRRSNETPPNHWPASRRQVDNRGMTDRQNLKRRVVSSAQRLVVNPLARRLPVTMIETVGRKSGRPRRTPVGGRLVDNRFWLVSEHGEHAQYIRNIKANPAVRVRLNGRWRNGIAHLLPDDNPIERLSRLPRLNSALVRVMGTDLLTVRVDLD